MSEVCYSFTRPVFQPAMRVIESITNAFPAVVTTSVDHQYIDGTIVRLNITPNHGMTQANQKFAPISVIDDTSFSIAIDTTYYDAFVIPSVPPASVKYTCSQCIPIGEVNGILTAAQQNVLPYAAS